jgi:hypothetical protein
MLLYSEEEEEEDDDGDGDDDDDVGGRAYSFFCFWSDGGNW